MTIIDIAKHDRRLKCFYKTKHNDEIKWFLFFLKTHLMLLVPFANKTY